MDVDCESAAPCTRFPARDLGRAPSPSSASWDSHPKSVKLVLADNVNCTESRTADFRISRLQTQGKVLRRKTATEARSHGVLGQGSLPPRLALRNREFERRLAAGEERLANLPGRPRRQKTSRGHRFHGGKSSRTLPKSRFPSSRPPSSHRLVAGANNNAKGQQLIAGCVQRFAWSDDWAKEKEGSSISTAARFSRKGRTSRSASSVRRIGAGKRGR